MSELQDLTEVLIERLAPEPLRSILEGVTCRIVDGYCPLCKAQEVPVDAQGNIIMSDDVSMAFEWREQHHKNCPVARIEKHLRERNNTVTQPNDTQIEADAAIQREYNIALLSRNDIVAAGFPPEVAAAFTDEEMRQFAQEMFEAYHDRFGEDLYEIVSKHMAAAAATPPLAPREAVVTLPGASISSNLLVGYLTRDGSCYPLCASCMTHEPVVRVIYAPEALAGALICAQCRRFLIVEAIETAAQEKQRP